MDDPIVFLTTTYFSWDQLAPNAEGFDMLRSDAGPVQPHELVYFIVLIHPVL